MCLADIRLEKWNLARASWIDFWVERFQEEEEEDDNKEDEDSKLIKSLGNWVRLIDPVQSRLSLWLDRDDQLLLACLNERTKQANEQLPPTTLELATPLQSGSTRRGKNVDLPVYPTIRLVVVDVVVVVLNVIRPFVRPSVRSCFLPSSQTCFSKFLSSMAKNCPRFTFYQAQWRLGVSLSLSPSWTPKNFKIKNRLLRRVKEEERERELDCSSHEDN